MDGTGMVIFEKMDILYRTFLTLGALLLLTKIMGRKSVAQLTLYDYVIGLVFGNIGASIAVDRSIEVSDGIISLLGCTIWIMGINMFLLRNVPARKYIESEPIMVIYEGAILENNLRKNFYTIDSLLALLREKDIFDPGSIRVGIIESNGQLSFIEKDNDNNNKDEITSENKLTDFSVHVAGRELIVEGKIVENVLKHSGVSKQWVLDHLKSRNIQLNEVTVAVITPEGELYIDTINDNIPKSIV